MMNGDSSPTGLRHKSEHVIQQFLHGYDDGHRLLAGSSVLSDEARRIMDRLSDAVGTRPDSSADGYLTGYPLPDGKYALARTWYAWELPRPNCVWTHTFLLDSSFFDDPAPLRSLLHLFHRPGPGGRAGYAITIYLPEKTAYANGSPAELPFSVPFFDLVELLDSLYQTDDGMSWLEHPDAQVRETLALQIWAQQWPVLRRSFSFCTGALEPRSIGKRAFDLCLVPEGHGSAFRSYSRLSPNEPSPEASELARDLIEPSPSLRRFIEFGASGSERRVAMSALTRIWLAIYHDRLSPLDTLDRLRIELLALGPRPVQMRRLKRSIFRLPNAVLERVMAPKFVLRAVTSDLIASTLTPDDASITGWAKSAWNSSPGDVVDTYVAALGRDSEVKLPKPDASAAEVAPDELRQTIIEIAAPSDLEEIATRAPSLLIPILMERTDSAWWLAWTLLPDEAISYSLAVAQQHGAHVTLEMAERACAALIGSELPANRAAEVWELLAAQDGRLAVEGLVAALSSAPRKVHQWRPVLSGHVDSMIAVVDAGPPDAWLAVLAELMPPTREVMSRGTRPWLRLANPEQLANLRRGLGLLMLLGLKERSPDPAFIAVVYAHVYRRLAEEDATDEWRLLGAELPGSQNDWDRCGRLAQAVARKLAPRSKRARDRTIHVAAAEYPLAAERLENELRRRTLFPFFTDRRSSE
jgi:GTPase-associated protein 1